MFALLFKIRWGPGFLIRWGAGFFVLLSLKIGLIKLGIILGNTGIGFFGISGASMVNSIFFPFQKPVYSASDLLSLFPAFSFFCL
mgnify:CR=1 FL=1